ncbi:SU10 major capsid protein, partial [Victivallis vadensis]
MPNEIKTYSLTNKARDLSSAMNTVIAGKGRFLSRFKSASPATNHKHEWLEDQIKGRGFTVTAYASGKATLSAADFLRVKVGTRFTVAGHPVVFKVATLEEADKKITAAVVAANGDTAKTALAAGDICRIVGTPVRENSREGDGEYTRRTVGSAYNHTQIIRKDLGISNSALATKTIDQVENSIARQTEFALQEIDRDMNRQAIWGIRTERDEANDVFGEAGGLYNFATALAVDASGGRLTSKLVNDAVMKVTEEGGNPTALYCTPDQARVLANEYKNNITVMRDDKARGVYVAVVVNEANGQNIEIIGDPDFNDADAWLCDDDCFALSWMRPVGDTDSTPPDADGISR